jgi:CHAT domain-containing protein/tetratricopeptide (TPR) repeat protein
MIELSQEQLLESIEALIAAQTWEEKKRLVEAQRDLLLTEAADQTFASLLEQKKSDTDASRLLEEYHNLVARCRDEGIELAFASFLLPTELEVMLAESERLTQPGEMPRKIEVCKAALRLVDHTTEPQRWASLQNHLADSLIKNPLGDRAENLEQAISHCEQALTIYTQKAFPQDWAATQLKLAKAYTNRIRGEKAAYIEQAIFHCEQALEVYTHESFPFNWAATQYVLAVIYAERIRGECADNMEQAIFHYHQALEVHEPTAYPHYCRDTAYSLGNLLYDLQRYPEARVALETAHQAIEAMRGEVQRDLTKRALAGENVDLYARLVSCCLHERDEAAAFRYTVAGKGRAFVDQLACIRLDPSALEAEDPALAAALRMDRALRQQIDDLRSALIDEGDSPLTGASFSKDMLSAQLAALRQQPASHWKEMTYKYPALTATQQAPMLTTEQARALANELDATLVEYYCHTEGWCAFVVTSQSVHYIPLPLVNDGLLARMASWVRQVESPSGTGRNPLSYRRLSEWYDAVFAPLSAYLPLHLPVILAPFGQLHVLPLAAAPHPQTGHFVAEDYQLSFAPSLAALYTVREQARRTGSDGSVGMQRLLNVAYPGTPGSPHHLPNVLPEAQTIAAYFAQATPLYQEAATPDAVVAHSRDQDAVHFGCHGWFDAKQPVESGLLLAGGMLTVQRIINELRLDRARLATQGACESGRAALQSGDEHVGLMQAILTTGVQAVVASLWKVDDDATHALFATFYANLVAGQPPAEALQEAARLVREHPEHPNWTHPLLLGRLPGQRFTLSMHGPEQIQSAIDMKDNN